MRARDPKELVAMSIRLTAEQLEFLQQLSVLSEIPVVRLIRKAVEEYIAGFANASDEIAQTAPPKEPLLINPKKRRTSAISYR